MPAFFNALFKWIYWINIKNLLFSLDECWQMCTLWYYGTQSIFLVEKCHKWIAMHALDLLNCAQIQLCRIIRCIWCMLSAHSSLNTHICSLVTLEEYIWIFSRVSFIYILLKKDVVLFRCIHLLVIQSKRIWLPWSQNISSDKPINFQRFGCACLTSYLKH